MKSAELREKYLAFFEEKGCKRMPSSSLIPDDPSMLLTSAGMVQFKPYFLQQKQLENPYVGTTTVQKCVRTTDIDIIGTTGRHFSFFEMLGNFSFGEYFKQEMCAWALEFSIKVLKFDMQRLYFTVYLDDDETIDIWKSLGVAEDHITRLGEDDNFWVAGPTGPCGPCSELYYDQGEEFGCGKPDCAPGCDCDRYLEYWNCVFTQYDRQEDGTLLPLPKRNIDTGMGLERTAAILQGVRSNYDTDIIRGLIAVAERLSNKTYGGSFDTSARDDLAMRIIADHSRAACFMIADGILPANEGRGYVLRRLLRRAMRYGQLLGVASPFLGEFIAEVIGEMGLVYPELQENRALLERIIHTEEERFAHTLRQGQSYLNKHLAEAAGRLSGEIAFELHDRFGFPIDLTIEIAGEQGVEVDRDGFEEQMTVQRERARAHAKDDAWGMYEGTYSELLAEQGGTQFVGYSQQSIEAKVVAIILAGEQVTRLTQGQQAQVILDRTPFYGEKGGQVGDTGELLVLGRTTSLFIVEDTQMAEGVLTLHIGCMEDGTLEVGDTVCASIDTIRRERIQRNHTATHLLHYALRTVLGEHVKQAGSLVAPERLRFDFTHPEALSSAQIVAVEQLANNLIMEDSIVSAYETSLDKAREEGVTALFGEKYGEEVRVLCAGDQSRELCGGTHVERTAQIGFVKIVSESSVGSNMRRIEALTSFDALEYMNRVEKHLQSVCDALKCSVAEAPERVERLKTRVVELEATQKSQQGALLKEDADELLATALDKGYRLVVARADGLDVQGLRSLWDAIRERAEARNDNATLAAAGIAVVLGGITTDGTPLLLAAGTSAAQKAGFDAGATIKHIASYIKGGGGGKAAMAQAGGKDAAGLNAALDAARI